MTNASLSAEFMPTGVAGAAASPAHPGLHARYLGRGWPLFWIYLKNLLLSLVTLGIYRFWGETNIRRYIWSHLQFHDEPFEYTGTGKELFFGFLKALLVLFPLIGALSLMDVFLTEPVPFAIGQIARTLIVLTLIYVGAYAARRYRMSRTLWRGIRFQQVGSAWTYAWLALRGFLLTVVTLGLYTPFMSVRLKQYEMSNLSFGSQRFAFEGQGRDLFKPFLIAWLLAIPTLFLSLIWYSAASHRYYAERTSIAGLRFSMSITGWQLLRLHLGNLLLFVVSGGLLYALVVKRVMNFWCGNLAIQGTIDFAAIAQASGGPKTGEGLASYFSVDGIGV